MLNPMESARPSRWLNILVFMTVYALLQVAYQSLRTGSLEPVLIDAMTVRPAAGLIGWLHPADGVVAAGPRLVWIGGSLALLAGCDGFELMALFVAAVTAADVSPRRGVCALIFGCIVIWLLNQARILVLYDAFRHARDRFDEIHSVWGPLGLIATVALMYRLMLSGWPRRSAT